MAKQIQPIEVSYNSQIMYTLTSLDVRIIADDLTSACALYFSINDENNSIRAQGNHNIAGEDYENWDGNNDYPYQFVADKEGLILI